MYKTKLKAHTVQPMKSMGKVKAEGPKEKPRLGNPELFVSHAGTAARGMKPPPVRA